MVCEVPNPYPHHIRSPTNLNRLLHFGSSWPITLKFSNNVTCVDMGEFQRNHKVNCVSYSIATFFSVQALFVSP